MRLRRLEAPVRRRRFAAVGAAALAALAIAPMAWAAPPVFDVSTCDPYRAQIDQAQAQIARGATARASQTLQQIVAADATNIMGNFLLGTLKLAQSSASVQQQGLSQVQFAVAQIPKRPAACARALHWYSLYITVGAQYYGRQDIVNAKLNLELALSHRDSLRPSSLPILLDDLGRVSLAQGDLKSAVNYYEQAAKLGNKNSAAAIAMVRQLQASAGPAKR